MLIKIKLSIRENAAEKNVCEMAVILSKGRWVNTWNFRQRERVKS